MAIEIIYGPVITGGRCVATVKNNGGGNTYAAYSLTLYGSGGFIWRTLDDGRGDLLPGATANHAVTSGDCVYADADLRQ